jgi:small subunit ribosomal protein S2e
MGDEGDKRGGFGRGRGRGGDRGGRGRGDRGGRGGRGRGDKGGDKEEWVPCTKLGRLVKEGKIKSVEEIFLFSLPIKEYQVVDYLLGPALRDEVMKIMPVQKQTTAGQRTRFKCYVAVGDGNGHLGLGVKAAKEVATAIRGGIINAKQNLVPIRRGYWGFNAGQPHTVPCKVSGKSGSVRVRLIPAPRGSGIVASLIPKKLLNMAGIEVTPHPCLMLVLLRYLLLTFLLPLLLAHRTCTRRPRATPAPAVTWPWRSTTP